jgi:hypothetical protein
VTTAADASRHAGLLEKLMAKVRPEFRADVVFADASDPVLRGSSCRIPGCDRPYRARGLCLGHYSRWRDQGKPPLEAFLGATTPGLVGRRSPQACAAPNCHHGSDHQGLCAWHDRAWKRAGQPDRASWLAKAPAAPHKASCRLSFCALWALGDLPFCRSHYQRWRDLGKPDVEEFVHRCEHHGEQRFDFRPLAPQLRLELQYALQCRHDERRSKTTPETVMPVVRAAARSGVTSLLDWPEDAWRADVLGQRGRASKGLRGEPGFVVYARRQLEDLQHGDGWEAEYARDVWRLRKLGVQARGQRAHLRFDRIAQPWLKARAKRWLRLRVTNGLSSGQLGRDMDAITRFATFLAAGGRGAGGVADVDRAVLEHFLAELADSSGWQAPKQTISSLGRFFQAIRQHRWDETLPTSASFFAEDYPKRPKQLPRYLAEHVMTQIERPDNLNRWPNPADRRSR